MRTLTSLAPQFVHLVKTMGFQQKGNIVSQNFEKKTKFLKRDLSASPIDGLTQNINIDLRMTRRHQKIL